MTLHVHHLNGCSPAPLANYLKALGILRLIVEQGADRAARGWWQDEHFCLLSKLSREELETFFLERYKPTPLLSPWNGGSGFFRTWDAKAKRLRNSKNARALDDLVDNEDPRLSSLRRAVEEVRRVLPAYCKTIDVSSIPDKERGKLLILPEGDGPTFPVISKDDAGKARVQAVLIRFSRTTPFYSSALVEVEGKITCPSLWGSGGNDGNIDYTGRFLENLNEILNPEDKHLCSNLLGNALYGGLSTGYMSKASGKVGQFLPCGAGGANVTTGTGSQNDTHLNPWDFVLMLEGAVMFASCATRRLDPTSLSQASAPFAVRSHAAGFPSPGSEDADRGEQWVPLWSQPSTLGDIVALFGEGRLQLKRQTVNRPLDAARAISRLGVARGVESFMRYGYLKRNGKSMLAVPLGQVHVRQQPRSHLIDDIAPWMDRLQRRARDKHAPARLVQVERRLANAVFAALTHDYSPERWQAILRAAVAVESLQAAGTAIEAGPIPKLQPEWVAAVDDHDTPEVRLAVSLGSAAGDGYGRDPIRHHWLPLQPGARRFNVSDKRLAKDSRVVMTGRDALADFAAIVQRRLIEAGMNGQRRLPLVAAAGCSASLADVAQFLSGAIDLSKLFDLARAFMATDWRRWRRAHSPHPSRSEDRPEEAWLALRLTSLPWPLTREMDIPAESGILRRLLADDSGSAVATALSRLRSAGIRVPIQGGITDALTARRWAAALVFPINHGSAQCAAAILDPSLRGTVHA